MIDHIMESLIERRGHAWEGGESLTTSDRPMHSGNG